jgi:type I restriction-modification system DNA methylase subunit
MPTGFDTAFARVKELVADFRANEKFYLSPAYQEQEARRDFIDKFWLALGWDVNHDTQKNPLEQEVKVERKEHSNTQRRADYAFYLHPNYRDVRFYVEAKKPHGDIATADNYFQINRYGWSGKTKIGILHDFEQFEIVDCRLEPKIDKALSRNIRKYKYPDYEDAEKFAEIYWIFSREAVANGSLEKFIATLPKRRAKDVEPSEIDDSFLKMLDQLRDELARLFKNKNPKLDGDCLTEITQRTLDRFVFTRFLEDKFIEPQRIISTFGSRGSAWDDFITASRRLDKIYNGVVYKHNDWLDEKVKIDDDAFAEICRRFSHVNSPYDFNEIPIHILGSIYERFLGKVIVTTDKRARLEEKPEVRKAGGVYYTPEYIVRYIVENTVGKAIEGKTPAQIAEMRFADIACGSGSFLLGIYDLLIRHHTRYYNENRDKAKIAGKVKKEHKADVEEREDGLHLTLYKKREILLANIYGVDIDPQAVEVAQLSLYLKLLQDETPGSARQYYLDFEQQALLPKLDKNIVCGNSLIGSDILTGQLFASDEEMKLNPMDFEQRFPHIFSRGRGNESGSLRETAMPLDFNLPGVPLHEKFSYKKKKSAKVARPTVPEFEGGFDAIVGNPPYVRMEAFKEIKNYLETHYQSHDERADLYVYFIERALRLIRSGGRYGIIVSNKWVRSKYGERLRGVITANASLETLIDFGELPVFEGAATFPVVFIAKCGKPRQTYTFGFTDGFERELFKQIHTRKITLTQAEELKSIPISSINLADVNWKFGSASSLGLFDKLTKAGVSLGKYTNDKIRYGIKTGLVEAFIIDGATRKRLVQESPKAAEIIKPYVVGDDVRKYHISNRDRFLIYTYHGIDMRGCSSVLRFLEKYKDRLRCRATRQEWYELQQPQYAYSPDYECPKIIYPDIAKESRFAFDETGIYPADTTFVIPLADYFLLAILNSRVAFYFLSQICPVLGDAKHGGRLRLKLNYVQTLPIPHPADKARHDRMVELVEQMLAARKQLAGAQSDKDKDFYTNRCDGLDRQIDDLVYDLYALTPAEIKIVEGTAK